MNQEQQSGGQPFEEIRILGLEAAEDEVEPGRSVFGAEPDTGSLPHWTEPPTPPVGNPAAGFGDEEPRWADDVPEHHESQQPVGSLDEPVASAFFDDPPAAAGTGTFDPPLMPPEEAQEGGGQPAAAGGGRRSRAARRGGGSGDGGRDMPTAVLTGLALGALALISFRVGASAAVALATVVLVLAAVEFYGSVRRVGCGGASCSSGPWPP